MGIAANYGWAKMYYNFIAFDDISDVLLFWYLFLNFFSKEP